MRYQTALHPEENWQGHKDSNPGHAVLETAALPAELYPCVFDVVTVRCAQPNGLAMSLWRRRWDSNPCGPKTNPNGLANRPLQPLEYFSELNLCVAERVGFEPTAPFGVTGFQDRLHKPLGHLSVSQATFLVTHPRLELGTP